MRLNDLQVSYKTVITHIHWKSIAQEKTETNGLQKHLGKLEENLRLFHSGLMHANDEALVHAPNKTRGKSPGQDTSSYKFSTVSLHNLAHNLT